MSEIQVKLLRSKDATGLVEAIEWVRLDDDGKAVDRVVVPEPCGNYNEENRW